MKVLTLFSKASSEQLGSLPRVDSTFGVAYPTIIVDKIINLMLSKLTDQPLFDEARSLGLEDAMKEIFTSGKFKGFFYFRGKDLVAITSGTKPDDKLSQFTSKEVDITTTGQLYSIILEQSVNISKILANESTNIALASTLMYKGEDLRKMASSDVASSVHKACKKAIEDSKDSNLLVMDKEDNLEMFSNTMSENNKSSVSLAIDNLVLATGFPASFFSGKFDNGLGSTSENERTMIDSALRVIYSLYYKKFFMFVDKSIEVEKDIALALASARGIIDLAQFDERIDIEEIYRQIGIPLRGK